METWIHESNQCTRGSSIFTIPSCGESGQEATTALVYNLSTATEHKRKKLNQEAEVGPETNVLLSA